MENVKVLNNDVVIPSTGIGLWQVRNKDQVETTLSHAYETGYRLIDTAAAYGNEKEVGKTIKNLVLPREELFITTKLWNSDQGYQSTLQAFKKSMKLLQLDYLDLYLIHWAVQDKFLDSWRAMEKLYEEGYIRAIGVCNFQISHLDQLISNCNVLPVINQIEYHPYLVQNNLHDYCLNKNIQVEAWSPLGQGSLVHDRSLLAIAEKYNKSVAQVILKWHMHKGIIPIPKSSNPKRIKENFNIFDFSLNNEDIVSINKLNENRRFGPHPDHFHLVFG
ncbi:MULTISPECIES: aldo/keto reductase [Bacillus]|uniref:Glyoxal reductase n=2 Tax=Bacillus TaxID=1386 RepID=A0A0M4G902_9BACI|nr:MULTISPECIES: aldo/keto reductase [Bacillus]ALC81765.1 glyoxal reductase [Bacillus gobiensis]MBP1080859.1 diketogulonate reductase-like aldo/keto reductase [Bacillus capparidis]MED1097499.1 aldo/keto reductase [Bacillus capparidis]